MNCYDSYSMYDCTLIVASDEFYFVNFIETSGRKNLSRNFSSIFFFSLILCTDYFIYTYILHELHDKNKEINETSNAYQFNPF